MTGHDQLLLGQSERRADMLNRVSMLYNGFGSMVHTLGSHASANADMFSDLDIWVEHPDTLHERLVECRRSFYERLGPVLTCWERPRFAPLDGMHSILLYGGDDTEIPLELNVFHASHRITKSVYGRYFYPESERPKFVCAEYPWSEGEDDPSMEARMQHVMLVSQWAAKMVYRGAPIEMAQAWVRDRYEHVLTTIPGLRPIDENIGVTSYIREVLENIASIVHDPLLQEASWRIQNSLEAGMGYRALSAAGIRMSYE